MKYYIAIFFKWLVNLLFTVLFLPFILIINRFIVRYLCILFSDPSVPTITGITSFASHVPQTFPQLVPQTVNFSQVFPYPQTLQMSGVQQSAQVIGLQSTPITMTSPIITQGNIFEFCIDDNFIPEFSESFLIPFAK